jgi:hypothetical protein
LFLGLLWVDFSKPLCNNKVLYIEVVREDLSLQAFLLEAVLLEWGVLV